MTLFRRLFVPTFAMVIIAGVIPLAACGGGGGGDDDGGSIGDLSGQVDLKTTVPLDLPDQVIEISGGAFSPDAVTIKAGTKVVWTWKDTSACALQFAGKTGPEQTSGTFEFTFTDSGSNYSYQCAGKPDHTGKITVE
ncbi:MAG: hypothetical protein AB7N24_16970 [Dehalococcoidia bacterium]